MARAHSPTFHVMSHTVKLGIAMSPEGRRLFKDVSWPRSAA
jgi:ABC-type branched-subunit amino acid transport system ATPase component